MRHKRKSSISKQKTLPMTVTIKSHADFRRFLAEPRARIQVTKNTIFDSLSELEKQHFLDKGMFEVRVVKKLQTNAVAFCKIDRSEDSTSWMYWDKGTKHWSYNGDVVVVPNPRQSGHHIEYRCFFAD